MRQDGEGASIWLDVDSEYPADFGLRNLFSEDIEAPIPQNLTH